MRILVPEKFGRENMSNYTMDHKDMQTWVGRRNQRYIMQNVLPEEGAKTFKKLPNRILENILDRDGLG